MGSAPDKGLDLVAKSGRTLPRNDNNGSVDTRGRQQISASAPESEEGHLEIERLRKTVGDLHYVLHGLTHDLREPIRTIECYSEMLGSSSAVQNDPNLSERVHFISGAAQRMDALVERMLEYSQLIGAEPHQPSQIDMNSVIQAALANLQLKIEESGAVVVCDSLPPVVGDHVQLVELVQNLLANSMKYRSAAPPQIFIKSTHRGVVEQFSIEDNGMGMDPEYSESVFRPFKRLHGQELPGTGLGLAICRRIVELHHGKIWAESAPGRGSTFCFTLPAWISRNGNTDSQ